MSENRQQALARYAEQFNQSQSLKYFGVTVGFPSLEEVRIVLQVRPEHRGGLGTDAVNGGVLAAMFDLAIGCTPALLDPTRRTATMQLSMSFERPVSGSVLHVRARIDTAGTAVLFASAVLYDEKDQPCARCQGVVRLSKQPWKSGESPAIN
jgi:acyl-coenzyme A thioesterase PaaI-like protein